MRKILTILIIGLSIGCAAEESSSKSSTLADSAMATMIARDLNEEELKTEELKDKELKGEELKNESHLTNESINFIETESGMKIYENDLDGIIEEVDNINFNYFDSFESKISKEIIIDVSLCMTDAAIDYRSPFKYLSMAYEDESEEKDAYFKDFDNEFESNCFEAYVGEICKVQTGDGYFDGVRIVCESDVYELLYQDEYNYYSDSEFSYLNIQFFSECIIENAKLYYGSYFKYFMVDKSIENESFNKFTEGSEEICKSKQQIQISTTVPEPENTPVPEPENTPVPEPENTPVSEPENTPVPEPENTPVPEFILEDYGYKERLIYAFQNNIFMAEDFLKTGGKNQQPPSENEIREFLGLPKLINNTADDCLYAPPGFKPATGMTCSDYPQFTPYEPVKTGYYEGCLGLESIVNDNLWLMNKETEKVVSRKILNGTEEDCSKYVEIWYEKSNNPEMQSKYKQFIVDYDVFITKNDDINDLFSGELCSLVDCQNDNSNSYYSSYNDWIDVDKFLYGKESFKWKYEWQSAKDHWQNQRYLMENNPKHVPYFRNGQSLPDFYRGP